MSTSVIVGASRGIGLEMVRQLLERPDASMPGRRGAAGGRVVATCRDPASATALAELRARYPARLSVLPLDVTDVPSIEAAAAAVAASHGRVDVILNVAAVLHVEGEMKPETSLARLDEAAALRAYHSQCSSRGLSHDALVITRYDLHFKLDMYSLLGRTPRIDSVRMLWRESGGEAGVNKALDLLERDVSLAMGLLGCRTTKVRASSR